VIIKRCISEDPVFGGAPRMVSTFTLALSNNIIFNNILSKNNFCKLII